METGLVQGTGNELGNYIIGGDFGGKLAGNGGNDTLAGRESGDTLNGGGQNDLLIGDAGNDSLIGSDGDDTLNGGAGNDRMAGGTGNDRYIVDSMADTIFENAGAGLDEVSSNSDYVLGVNVENLHLLSAATPTHWDGTGNGLNNSIIGSNGNNSLGGAAGSDTLEGLDGNDTLDGGAGADKLLGGKGNDSYRIDNALDTIVEDGGDKYDAALDSQCRPQFWAGQIGTHTCRAAPSTPPATR
jgi:Ca2+-binding RTX toxin-like protein